MSADQKKVMAAAIATGLSIADVLQVLLGAYWFIRVAGTRKRNMS